MLQKATPKLEALSNKWRHLPSASHPHHSREAFPGLHGAFVYQHAQLLQLCPVLCDPLDQSLALSVHGLLQAGILEWVAMPSSRRSSQPRDRTCVSYVSIGRLVLYHLCHLGGPFMSQTPRQLYCEGCSLVHKGIKNCKLYDIKPDMYTYVKCKYTYTYKYLLLNVT